METRPKIKVKRTFLDNTIEILGWISLLTIWMIVLSAYSNLPVSIPIHYNLEGQADGFGEKFNIFTLPVISTLMFIGLSLLNNYPHIFNYRIEITEENATDQYTIATRMIRYLKLIIVVVFGLISYKTIESSENQSDGMGIWFLPLILGLIFIPIVYFIKKSSK
jgi:uncharacterized membrane protein